MVVYITCPYCKERDIIEAEVSSRDTGDVVYYPEECPACHHEVTQDMIADIQWQAHQDIEERMHRQIHHRLFK